MPHLSVEYSTGIEPAVDMIGFLSAMRDAIIGAPGDFPIAGTRVRAYRADHCVVADGGEHDFAHLTFRIGAGRDLATRKAAAAALYAAAEAHLKPLLEGRSFALSLELVEMEAETALKRWNAIRDHL